MNLTEFESLGLTIWATAGGCFRVLGLSSLPRERREEAHSFILEHKAELAGLALPPLTSHGGPDYAAWCPRYFRSCFECPDYLPDKLRFCRAWNRAFHGADVVNVAMVGEEGAEGKPSRLPEPTMPESDTGRGWWTYGRKKAGASTGSELLHKTSVRETIEKGRRRRPHENHHRHAGTRAVHLPA